MPKLQDIQDAADRLEGVAVKTPLLEAFDLSEAGDRLSRDKR